MTKDSVDTVQLNKHINVTVAKRRPLTIRRTLENYYSPKSWNTQPRGIQIIKVNFFFFLSTSEYCPSYNTFFNYCYIYIFVVFLSSCPYAANPPNSPKCHLVTDGNK